MVNQAKLRLFWMAKVYKYGYEVPRNHDDAMRLDAMNKNTKWLDAESLELAQLDEYNTFEDKSYGSPIPKGYKKICVHFVMM